MIVSLVGSSCLMECFHTDTNSKWVLLNITLSLYYKLNGFVAHYLELVVESYHGRMSYITCRNKL